MSKYQEFVEKFEELADLKFKCTNGEVKITKRQADLIFEMFVLGVSSATREN